MNLYDGNQPQEEAGHDTVVNNKIGKVKVSGGQKALFWFLYIGSWILAIIPGIIFTVVKIKKTNWFNKQQLEINNQASNIDVQLQKRSDTLIKLVDAVKGHIKFETNVLEKVTALRSGNMTTTEKDTIVNDVARAININVEAYPNLSSPGTSVHILMTESAYIEKEIAAARRLYNQNVTNFNQEIWIFPWIVVANKLNLETIPLFAASAESRKDVKIEF